MLHCYLLVQNAVSLLSIGLIVGTFRVLLWELPAWKTIACLILAYPFLADLHIGLCRPRLPKSTYEGPTTTCAICLEDLRVGEDTVHGVCHSFHHECLSAWTNRRKTSCPCCRQTIVWGWSTVRKGASSMIVDG